MSRQNFERFAPVDEVEKRYDFLKRAAVHLGGRAVEMTRGELVIEIKPDGSEVTNIDETLNHEFIEMTQREFPRDLVWGEEASNSEKGDIHAADKEWLWILDPNDGTKKLIEAYQ